MISMTKANMVKYLRDYSAILDLSRKHSTVSLRVIFYQYMISFNRLDDANDEYYFRMTNFFRTYILIKNYSFYEDFQIERYLEDNLDFDDIKEDIFVNKSDSKYFSKKMIIRLIRNALNHSEGDKKLFSVSVNGKYIEIYLLLNNMLDKNGNRKIPVPFHIKMNMEQFEKITYSLKKAGQNIMLSDFIYDVSFDLNNGKPNEEVDKIKFRYYSFDKKIPISIIRKVFDLLRVNSYSKDEYFKKMNDIEKIIGEGNFKIQTVPFDEYQRAKALEFIKIIKESMNKVMPLLKDPDFGKTYYENMLNYYLIKIIPSGMHHYDQNMFEYTYSSEYADDFNMSFEEIMEQLNKIFLYKGNGIELNSESDADKIKKFNSIWNTDVLRQKLELLYDDVESRIIYPSIMYFDYAINNLSTDEYLLIGNKKIKREKIRNSLTHGRWFVGPAGYLEFYDCPNEKENELNFDFHETIKITDLYFCVENIYNEYSDNKTNTFKR